jgi:hypothetical protein
MNGTTATTNTGGGTSPDPTGSADGHAPADPGNKQPHPGTPGDGLQPVPQAPVPTLDEVHVANQAIEKLKAKGSPLSLEQQQQLDTAEKTVARKTEANILARKKAQNGQLHPTAAKDLAKAQEALAKPAPRDRGPLPSVEDARRSIQDLSGKAASGTLSADEAHQHAHAQRAIAQQRVNDLAPAEANGTLTDPQRRELAQFRSVLAASPYGTELPKGPPPGYDPHATNPAHRDWHPPQGDKPDHPANDKFTPEALALSDGEIKDTMDRLKDEGHAHERHGPDVTEGQLADRSMHGIDPITQTREDGVKRGQDHSYSGNATQFTSDRAMVQSLKVVEGSHEFHLKLKLAEAHNASNPGKPRPQFVVKGVSLEKALGPQYDKHIRGVSRKGPAAAPTGGESINFTNGKVMAVYRYNRSTGKYQLHTMYPDPK